MQAETASEVGQLLDSIEATQRALIECFEQQRVAVRAANLPAMHELSAREQNLIAGMQSHLRKREQILRRLKPTATLEEFARTAEEPARTKLLSQVDRTRRSAEFLRRESWSRWIVSQQSLRHFGEVLDLIANGGRKAPVYSNRPASDLTPGGALLDASA